MRTVTFLMLGASALAIAGCSNLPGSSLGATFSAEPYLAKEHGSDANFNGALAKEYTALARWQANDYQRWMNATAFIHKAKMAEAGNTPAPWTPAELGVDGDATKKYDEVVSTIKANEDQRPAACAHAQAMWDLYLFLLRAEAAGDPIPKTSKDALAELNDALAACAPKMGPANYVVYFGFDKYNLTAAARDTLNEVVSAVNKMSATALSIVGHTDTVGTLQYNQALSERRAKSVGDYLADHGIPRTEMTLAGRSYLEPAVKTGNNVREPLNRRVEITLSK